MTMPRQKPLNQAHTCRSCGRTCRNRQAEQTDRHLVTWCKDYAPMDSLESEEKVVDKGGAHQ